MAFFGLLPGDILAVSPLLAVSGLAFVFLIIRMTFSHSKLHKIPGPWYTRYTRLPMKIATLTGRPIFYIHDLHQRYGRIVRIAPNEVSVVDADSHRRIFSHTNGFKKSDWYDSLNAFPAKTIFFKRDDQEHAVARRMYAGAMSKSSVRREWESLVKENVKLLVNKVTRRLETQGSADLLQYFRWMTSDVVAAVMFGEGFDQLATEEASGYVKAMEKTMVGILINSELPIVFQLAKRLPIPILQELFRGQETMISMGTIGLSNSRHRSQRKTMFSQALALEGSAGALDEVAMLSEAGGQLFAGSDTTAVTLVYIVYAVLSNPDVQARLEEEVSKLPHGFTDAQLEVLPYLNAVIDETHRLYGAVPSPLPREVPPQGAKLAGFDIPRGTVVTSQGYTHHRDPDSFANPLRFDPQRWIDGVDRKKVVFVPFGAGTRSCHGIHLAQLELRQTVATLFRELKGRLRLAPSATEKCMEFQNYFVVAPAGHKFEVQLAGGAF